MTEREFEAAYNTVAGQFGEDVASARAKAQQFFEQFQSAPATEPLVKQYYWLNWHLCLLYSKAGYNIDAAWLKFQAVQSEVQQQLTVIGLTS